MTSERLFINASSYFESLLASVNRAEISIDITIYIFHCDDLGQRITEALELALLRGVKVRLLIDGIGADPNITEMLERYLQLGGKLKIYHPLPWKLSQWDYSLTANQGIEKFRRLSQVINKRNHQKLIIIDNAEAWLGSFNLTADHLPQKAPKLNWLDAGIQAKDIRGIPLNDCFETIWDKGRFDRNKSVKRYLEIPFRFNFTRSLRRRHKRLLLRKLKQARNRAWFMNAYFIPDQSILRALKKAAMNGADVALVLPQKSDVFFIPWASSTFYESLLESGVRIYEYKEGILHAKTFLIDDWGSIGSSNINQRSLKHDLECDYTLRDETALGQLEDFFSDTLKRSDQIDKTKLEVEKKWQRVLGGIVLKLLRYWI